MSESICRTYWGSHGCCLERGHDGDCRCTCADEFEGSPDVEHAVPYYGPDTVFYGEDAALSTAQGL